MENRLAFQHNLKFKQKCTINLHIDIRKREYGEHFSRHFLRHVFYKKKLFSHVLSKINLNLPPVDKIFASHWLNDEEIVATTKCNNIIKMNIFNKDYEIIPPIKSKFHCKNRKNFSGIRTIEKNDNETFIVSGAHDSNHVSVYSLPDLKQYAVGINGHEDWLFDVEWLSNEIFVSGSRDGSICLWNLALNEAYSVDKSIIYPVKLCKNIQNHYCIRAISYNKRIDVIYNFELSK
ncbi:hypothetical protein A3Q56_07461 [Intoshia linei]|uniref:DDB1- and CUL4-associated factor 12 beta-propeller domain-containing protein n=1 Tax=Intoshia linei TaxID=1819745 RepID=A0A177ATI8_9BILA|nr:hypothetical protein A3Q56_07461 [Intoshia linei]